MQSLQPPPRQSASGFRTKLTLPGLMVQEVSAGMPLQLSVTSPANVALLLIVKVAIADCPATTGSEPGAGDPSVNAGTKAETANIHDGRSSHGIEVAVARETGGDQHQYPLEAC